MYTLDPANLAFVIIGISALGFVSNLLNWRFLNNRLIRTLYYLGTLVHESSHALLCVLTGAKIEEFKVFTLEPHVTHLKSKLPLIGGVLISLAPIAGGLTFLFLINKFWLGGYFMIPDAPSVLSVANLQALLISWPLTLIHQMLQLWRWQSWVALLLTFNVGAMIGPSVRDLMNIWPAFIVLFFVTSPQIVSIALLAIALIMVNIALQVIVIILRRLMKFL